MKRGWMRLGSMTLALALLCGLASAQNLVENGSFEEPAADSVEWPGYFGGDLVTGWTRGGTNGGLNNNLGGAEEDGQRSPFLGEGRPIPDGEQVYFIQINDPEVTLTQEIGGLEEGQHYLFIFYAGMRPDNPGADLVVTLGDEEMVNTSITSNSGPLDRLEVAFEYDSETYGEDPTLEFLVSKIEAEEDTSLVLDHVQIRPPELGAEIAGPGMVAQGDDIELNANVSEVVGDATYQWFYDGVELEGETGATLELLDVVIEDSGVYSVEVNDDLGSFNASFTLTVVEALPVSSSAMLAVLAMLLAAASVLVMRRQARA